MSKTAIVESIVLRAQIIYEIKSFTALLQKGAPLPDLYAARDKIKRLMQQLAAMESGANGQTAAPSPQQQIPPP